MFLILATALLTSLASQGAEASPISSSSCASAKASCAWQTLHLVSPSVSNLKDPVRVQAQIENGFLVMNFHVQTPTIEAVRALGVGQYPYMYDVVEVFVSVAGANGTHLPYYEFELSPYNQTFQVKIIDPRKKMINGVDMGLQHSVELLSAQEWVAHLEVPLARLGWDGHAANVVGNAFAILGARPNRSYWSLSLPPQEKPSFHQPQYFKPLVVF